jgi:hypothetical protein
MIVRRHNLNLPLRNIGSFPVLISQPELVKIAMIISAQNVFSEFGCFCWGSILAAVISKERNLNFGTLRRSLPFRYRDDMVYVYIDT